jgi:Rieske Fe-S protein
MQAQMLILFIMIENKLKACIRYRVWKGFILCCTFVILSLAISCKKYSPIDGPAKVDFTLNLNDKDNQKIKNNGNSIIINNLIIIRDTKGNYFALQQSCTYKQCNLEYVNSDNVVQCPCHGCIYDTYGTVYQGPAKVSLHSYHTSISGNMLHIYS